MCKVLAMAAKGRWRILLIVKVGSSSQTAEVVGGICAKIPNYCMSWISISEVSLFSSCCREIRVNVSQYLKSFLAFLKGRGGRWALLFLPTWTSSSVHTQKNKEKKTHSDKPGLLENKSSWWPWKTPASVSFLLGTLCPKSFMRPVNPIITQLTLKEGSAAWDHWTTLHTVK